MQKLVIIESPSTGGVFTKAIAQHLPDAFKDCSYVYPSPLAGVERELTTLPAVAAGCLPCLIIGEPLFVSKTAPLLGDRVIGAYALPMTQFVGVEHVDWLPRIKTCVPATMSREALYLASGERTSIDVVRPWYAPATNYPSLNRGDFRELTVSGWDASLPIVSARASSSALVLAAMAKNKKFRTILIGDATGEQLQQALDFYGVAHSRVAMSSSEIAWKACDLYLGLDHECYWPWDALRAFSLRLPVACLDTHVYSEIGDAGGLAALISAHDVKYGLNTGYTTNSTDVANTVADFCDNPVGYHVRAEAAAAHYSGRDARQFANELLKALFG